MSSAVFIVSLKKTLSCAELLDCLSPRILYGELVKKSLAGPPKTGALASMLSACTRSLFLQLCSLRYRLVACSRAAKLMLVQTRALAGCIPVMISKTNVVAKSKLEAGLELEGLFFAKAVTPEMSTTSPLSCFLYESNRGGRPAGRRTELVLHFH